MTNSIRRVEDLPDWFDIKKYEPVKKFHAADWAINIMIRIEFFDLIFHEDFKFNNNYLREAEKILELGAIIRDAKEDVKIKSDAFLCSLTLHSVYEIFEEVKDDMEKNKKEMENVELPEDIDDFSTPEWWEKSFNDEYCESDSDLLYLQVNLSAPDKILIKLFEDWLKEHRKKIGAHQRKRFFSESDFNDWYNYGVLPYMDLMFWSKYNEISIPYHIIGEAIIHPDIEIDVAEAVRKTTRKYVRQLRDRSTFNLLYAQGAYESGMI